MRPMRLLPWTGSLALVAVVLLGPLTTARVAAAAPDEKPPVPVCWNVKTTICTDCPDSDSKYCDPRSSDGPFSKCIQTVSEPCEGFTCSDVDAEVGPPCN